MSRFLVEKLSSLTAYTPGEQPRDRAYIKLNTNESPYPPSEEVLGAVSRSEVARLNLYSDPTCKLLREKIAERYGVSSDMVFVSNGSDDILNFAFMAFCDKNKGMAYADITYGFYKVFAELHRVKKNVIPLKDDFTIDLEAFENWDDNIVIANPNAPTGLVITLSEIERLLQKDRLVIVDEAYVDFGGESALSLVSKYDNLLVVRTFSKSRSLAGARLGFAFANPDIIRDLELIKYSTNPYDINRLTQVAGAAAIDSDKYYFDNCEKIKETRKEAVQKLEALGFSVIPSSANFVFTRHMSADGEMLYKRLKEKGVLVRHFTDERIKDYLRITVGLPSEMEILCEKLDEILKEVGVN